MPTLLDLCFANTSGYVEIAQGGLTPNHRQWIRTDKVFFGPSDENDIDYFFGPAIRREPKKMGKANCLGSWVCWVDVDRTELAEAILPPTATVFSGHGYHLYWRLRKLQGRQERIELANKVLATELGGDSAHNIDRLLRVPGTYNGKEDPPIQTRVVELRANRIYSINDLIALQDIDEKVKHKILTGDRRGYKSRSERDYAIIRELVSCGISDPSIRRIFEHHACGDKYREDPARGPSYLEHSIENARKTPGRGKRGKRDQQHSFAERDNCYFVTDGRGERQVSTFTFRPTMLLEGEQDFLVGDFRAQSTDYVWQDVTLPRDAFSGFRGLSPHLIKASWIWLGRDADIRHLLDHLVSQLVAEGIPRAVAVRSLGRHQLEQADREFVVAENCALASDGSVWWTKQESPIVYVETDRESPRFELAPSNMTPEDFEVLDEKLTQLNEPEVIWPMLGWFMAAPYKPVLEKLNYRFPILNVTGTRGSGKTTLLLEVFQPLLGVCNARGYDANTTRFVSLSLLGSTNAVPVNFSEFRVSSSQDFLRFILLSYDSGKDARGRPDQTTVTYPLTAPFTLDGEDKVSDPAALERVVVVMLTPRTIEEESPAWCALVELQELTDLSQFALPYWQFTLQQDAEELMKEAESDVYEAFPEKLPTRIRRNLTVVWFGVLSYVRFAESFGIVTGPKQGAEVLENCLENVYSQRLGRAVTAADEFVEFVVNTAAQKTRTFPWELEGSTLWFQHTPAYEYYVSRRASQRQATLTREALKLQLRELIDDYTVEPAVKNLKGRRVLAYGIDLNRAHEAGLDIPKSFDANSLVVDF